MSVTVVILTYNEARHIERAIRSVMAFADNCVVVDSGSNDDTVSLAKANGAIVLDHPFVNHARQLNWAIDQLAPETDWVFRVDADEVVSDALAEEINTRIPGMPSDVVGLTVPRRIAFLGRPIRHGGVFPVPILRLFRFGHGQCEDRWMDEHIVVDGAVLPLSGELLDHNLNPLGWWVEKHNRYASREAFEVLLTEQNGEAQNTSKNMGRHASSKRWIKRNIYNRLPFGLGPFSYFLYRFFVRGGFLDGYPGLAFHFLQGFWYRFLVDVKIYEARRYLKRGNGDIHSAGKEVLDIKF